MSKVSIKSANALRRQNRVKAQVRGTSARPRLAVKISNKNVSAQIIDDQKQATLISATSIRSKIKGNLSEKAVIVGKEVASKAKAQKISNVAFDRGAKRYHGRVKALAEAAREEGLKF